MSVTSDGALKSERHGRDGTTQGPRREDMADERRDERVTRHRQRKKRENPCSYP